MDASDLPAGLLLTGAALIALTASGWFAAAALFVRNRRASGAHPPAVSPPDSRAAASAAFTGPEADARQPRRAMQDAILQLGGLTVADIMVPRDEIVGLDIDAEMNDLIDIVATSRHTRLPVYRDNVNNVLGVLHLRRLVRHLQSSESLTRTDLLQLTEEPYYIPMSTPLDTQLFNFQKEKKRIALVVDEYGEIHGLATLEDILEEIVGEFTTDHGPAVPEIHPQPDGWYVIDGLALLRDINRALGWDLPTLGPKTLNGLVLEHLETLPENNVCLAIDDYRIETLQITDNLIRNLKLSRLPAPAPVEGRHDRVE